MPLLGLTLRAEWGGLGATWADFAAYGLRMLLPLLPFAALDKQLAAAVRPRQAVCGGMRLHRGPAAGKMQHTAADSRFSNTIAQCNGRRGLPTSSLLR